MRMRIRDIAPDRWSRIDELFARALDLEVRERSSFLLRVCGEDTELREAVEALLATETAAEHALGEKAEDFVDRLSRDVWRELAAGEILPDDVGEGTRVGPYRIVTELGRGGMGRVYLAERADQQFEKRVALKLVKRGMDTDEVLRRFRQERQILAGLEHPHIARLLDGGATADGRPYLVMEHVEGRPVDRWCEDRDLGVSGRLELFARVCDAVHHAHRRLVVHRDIKASNVLVTAGGEPKLLDFGIAKLLADDEDGVRTRTGMRVLTPELAAPEQLRGEPVGTATDVHGLGALLYELLTGRRPWGPDPRTGDPERDPPPERPSAVAAPARRRRLRGDLDLIVLRALHPDPERRYDSAAGLADDVRRHLAGFPVRARPDALGYRLGKWLGRHRSATAAAAVALVALFAVGAVVARERSERVREREASLAVSAFMEDLFEASDPLAAGGERLDTLRVLDLLERATGRIDRELGENVRAKARLLHTIGKVHLNAGAVERADSLLRMAVALRRSNGEPPSALGASLLFVGRAALERGRPDEAEKPLREALGLGDMLHPEDHAAVLVNLAVVHQERGEMNAADTLYRRALDRFRAIPGTEARQANVLGNLGWLAVSRGDFAAAAPFAREALALNRAALPSGHPSLARSINNLAVALRRTGDLAGAEPLYREALEIFREGLRPPHPMLAIAAMNHGAALAALDRPDEAEPLLREAVEHAREVFPPGSPDRALMVTRLADFLVERGRSEDLPEAETLAREGLELIHEARDENHPDVGTAAAVLADVLAARGTTGEALRLYRSSLQVLEDALPPGHVRTAEVAGELGVLLVRERRLDEAEPHLLASYEALADSDAPSAGDVSRAAARLVELYEAWGRPGRADAFRAAVRGNTGS